MVNALPRQELDINQITNGTYHVTVFFTLLYHTLCSKSSILATIFKELLGMSKSPKRKMT